MRISKVQAAAPLGDDRVAVGGPLAVIAIILVAINLRPGIVSVGPILPSIIGEFGLSHAVASLLTAIPAVCMGVLALPTPWLTRRFGRDPVLLLALLLLCLSTLARAFSAGTFELLLSTVGIGAGVAVAGTLIAGFIKARFPTRAAAMMGVYATALSFGAAVAAAITGPVAVALAPSGWRGASGMWGVVVTLAVFSWLAVMRSERKHRTVVPTIAAPTDGLPFGNRTAWLVALFFALQSFVFFGLVAWVAPMYREVGLSSTTAGLVFASLLIAFMLGNFAFGWLSTTHDRRRWLASCSILTLAGLVPIAIAPDLAPFVFVSLCALGLGGALTLGMTLPLDNADGVEEANAWNALVLTVGYLVAAAGPFILGYLRDAYGDFRPSIWLLVTVAGAMLLLTPYLQPHHHKEKERS